MAMRKISMGAVIAIAVTGLFLTMLSAGILTTSQTLPSGGTVTAVNIGIYSDSNYTQNCTSIDWGALLPGNSTIKTIYLKNTGTLPVTLSMTTSNWAPSNATQYLNLAWNRESYLLNTNSSIAADLTLTASSSAGNLTTFSFNVIITGTQ